MGNLEGAFLSMQETVNIGKLYLMDFEDDFWFYGLMNKNDESDIFDLK